MLLRRYVARVVAIDDGVRETLPHDINAVVVHNSFSTEQVANDLRLRAALASFKTGQRLKVGFVGNLHASKGIDCIVDAAEILAASGHPCAFFVVGGGTSQASGLIWRVLNFVGLAQNQGDSIRGRLEQSSARDDVHLLGATADIGALYEAIDVLVFPSRLDCPGRPVFEAAHYGVPSVVAVRRPFDDTFADGGTGLAISESDGRLLADALLRLHNDRALLRRLGDAAQALARRNFVPEPNAKKIEVIYEEVVEERRSGLRRGRIGGM